MSGRADGSDQRPADIVHRRRGAAFLRVRTRVARWGSLSCIRTCALLGPGLFSCPRRGWSTDVSNREMPVSEVLSVFDARSLVTMI